MKKIKRSIIGVLIVLLFFPIFSVFSQGDSSTVTYNIPSSDENAFLTELKADIKQTIHDELDNYLAYHSPKESGQAYYIVKKIPLFAKVNGKNAGSIGYIEGGTPVYCAPPDYNCYQSGQLNGSIQLKNITVVGDLNDMAHWMAICQIDNTNVFSGNDDGSSDYFTLPIFLDSDWNINVTVQ